MLRDKALRSHSLTAFLSTLINGSSYMATNSVSCVEPFLMTAFISSLVDYSQGSTAVHPDVQLRGGEGVGGLAE